MLFKGSDNLIQRQGRYTIRLTGRPAVAGYASVVGKKEGEGPFGKLFDRVEQDTSFGEKTWEKSESHMQSSALDLALKKAGVKAEDVDVIFAGDLLNQCIGSSFGLRSSGIPFAGIFGACSTMAESLAFASVAVESGVARTAAAVTSSHFCSAERQFRLPLQYGGQRTQSAQWTATGSGCVILSKSGSGPFVSEVTLGRLQDYGVTDMANMGAAMAPAAADTIKNYLDDTGAKPEDFDLIVTGDLGFIGSRLLGELLGSEGITLTNHDDCGMMIYGRKRQDVHAGGSGCGCSASVLCSKLLGDMRSGALKELLFIATGALMSPTSSQQGESIPAIAHLIHLSSAKMAPEA
jgi:stage V sporulation protein AD